MCKYTIHLSLHMVSTHTFSFDKIHVFIQIKLSFFLFLWVFLLSSFLSGHQLDTKLCQRVWDGGGGPGVARGLANFVTKTSLLQCHTSKSDLLNIIQIKDTTSFVSLCHNTFTNDTTSKVYFPQVDISRPLAASLMSPVHFLRECRH